MSEDMFVNIVGFAIINKEDELQCLNLESFVNISKETKDPLMAFKLLIEEKKNRIMVIQKYII
mgnify:CR=1 FL=1